MKKNDVSWTSQDGYKLLIKSKDYSETGKIWIGLKPLLGEQSLSHLVSLFITFRLKCVYPLHFVKYAFNTKDLTDIWNEESQKQITFIEIYHYKSA